MLSIINQGISAARVGGVDGAELLLPIDRVVAASQARNVVIVVVRNVPHPALPDGPPGGRRQAAADHQGEAQQLEQGE